MLETSIDFKLDILSPSNCSDWEQISNLWLDSFPDISPSFISFISENFVPRSTIFVLRENSDHHHFNKNRILSSLISTSISFSFLDKVYYGKYLSYIATPRMFRGRGFLTILLELLKDYYFNITEHSSDESVSNNLANKVYNPLTESTSKLYTPSASVHSKQKIDFFALNPEGTKLERFYTSLGFDLVLPNHSILAIEKESPASRLPYFSDEKFNKSINKNILDKQLNLRELSDTLSNRFCSSINGLLNNRILKNNSLNNILSANDLLKHNLSYIDSFDDELLKLKPSNIDSFNDESLNINSSNTHCAASLEILPKYSPTYLSKLLLDRPLPSNLSVSVLGTLSSFSLKELYENDTLFFPLNELNSHSRCNSDRPNLSTYHDLLLTEYPTIQFKVFNNELRDYFLKVQAEVKSSQLLNLFIHDGL